MRLRVLPPQKIAVSFVFDRLQLLFEISLAVSQRYTSSVLFFKSQCTTCRKAILFFI